MMEAAHGQGALDHGKNNAQFKRLEDIVESAGLHRLNGGGNRAGARHHDSHQARIDLARGLKQRDAVHPGHHQIR